MIEFKLPALGENIEQGDLVRLMIAPGATVSEGQAVMELETDKAVVEVPSSVSGKVQQILVKEGEKIKVGQVIFTVENHAGAAVAAAAPTSAPGASAQRSVQRTSGRGKTTGSSRAAIRASGNAATNSIDGRPSASRIPAARTGRKHFGRRSGAVDDRSGHQGFGRPAGDGTGNRQGGC